MLLDDLKQQTRPQHTRLEVINGMPATRDQYVALLESFHGYVTAWETSLAQQVGPDDPLRAGREKSTWLAEDLAFFGYSDADRAALPVCTRLPKTESRAQLLGACYVLEGSTLGGQFIARHLEQVLGLTDGQGYRYFRSYGPETGAMWQAFRQELLRHSSPETDPVMVDAARDTFDQLADWFTSRRAAVAV